MNITVLGAGAGGTTVAFDCAAHGHQASLFDFLFYEEGVTDSVGRIIESVDRERRQLGSDQYYLLK